MLINPAGRRQRRRRLLHRRRSARLLRQEPALQLCAAAIARRWWRLIFTPDCPADSAGARACVPGGRTTAALCGATHDRYRHRHKAAFNRRIDEDARDVVIFRRQLDETVDLRLPVTRNHGGHPAQPDRAAAASAAVPSSGFAAAAARYPRRGRSDGWRDRC